MELDPTLTRPELSCRLVASFLPQAEAELGADVVRAILQHAGLPEPYVRNPRHWVSIEYVNRLVQATARFGYGLEDTPEDYGAKVWTFWYRNGRASLDPENLGALFSALRALGSPDAVVRNLPALSRSGNPQLDVVVESRPDHFEVRVEYRRPELCAAAICWNMRGLLEAVPRVWGQPSAEVEHPACVARDGAPECIYHVTRASPVSGRSGRLALWSLGGAALGSLVSAAVGASLAPGLAVGAGWGLALALGLAQTRTARNAVQDGLRSLALVSAADERAAELWQEGQRLRRALMASKKLSGYLAADLVDRILEDPEAEVALGGRRTQAAVLFADIVGFTPRCEGRDPTEVVEELNFYFSCVDPALSERGGVVDKRIGDGIMAVFPEREGLDRPGARAVEAGLAMQEALSTVNRAFALRGWPPIQIRVGVAAGPLVQGNMGSPARLEYTVIGDTVNAAARLEGQAAPGSVLALRSCVEPHLADHVVDERTIRVKGKAERLAVVELRPEGAFPVEAAG